VLFLCEELSRINWKESENCRDGSGGIEEIAVFQVWEGVERAGGSIIFL
jgi:hypothetical protein